MTNLPTRDDSVVWTLVLASRSPRRQQLLTEAGLHFVMCTAETPETLDDRLGLDEAILEIARYKGLAIREQLRGTPYPLVLSSDTLVIINGDILGKPNDAEQAAAFLRRLSGSAHQVKTAMNFWDVTHDRHVGEVETSNVTFRNLSASEIQSYVASGEPMDKAGAYGIQGAGGKFIRNLDGNLDNVMGLSMTCVRRVLTEQKWTLR